jgi:hypothetical protein
MQFYSSRRAQGILEYLLLATAVAVVLISSVLVKGGVFVRSTNEVLSLPMKMLDKDNRKLDPNAPVDPLPPPPPPPCAPNCTGRNCGPDGCGGTCGTCSGTDTCSGGVCTCTPACTGKNCGLDGCGGSCGTCPGTETCISGVCACTPACTGKDCGPDGCGGSCGICSGTDSCISGVCTCTPACTGKNCGPDGCGGSCGTCPGTETCSSGVCTCTPACTGKNCGSDGCGGSCGPCPGTETCSSSGICACTPACTGKDCGPDGCGGSCGTCGDGNSCTTDTCSTTGVCSYPAIAPVCAAQSTAPCGTAILSSNGCGTCPAGTAKNCGTMVCSTDACGNSCGTCTAPELCAPVTGQCYMPDIVCTAQTISHCMVGNASYNVRSGECEEGYQGTGSCGYICMGDGAWMEQFPNDCKADCPASTASGCIMEKKVSGLQSGTCDAASGYTQGSCLYTCYDGAWTRMDNTCSPLTCVGGTIDHCVLYDTTLGGSDGRCDSGSGYSGSCWYSCSAGGWVQQSNSCVLSNCYMWVCTGGSWMYMNQQCSGYDCPSNVSGSYNPGDVVCISGSSPSASCYYN